MTSKDYIAAMAAKAARKEAVAKEWEEQKNQAKLWKAQREKEKARKEAEKLLCRIQAERKKAEREREKARKAAEHAQKTSDGDRRRHGRSNEATLNLGGTAELVGGGNIVRRTTSTNNSDRTAPLTTGCHGGEGSGAGGGRVPGIDMQVASHVGMVGEVGRLVGASVGGWRVVGNSL